MKFQKGLLLSDEEKAALRSASAAKTVEAKPLTQPVLGEIEKNRLFETQQEFADSSGHYLKVFGAIAVGLLIAGLVIAYAMQPGVGDQVRAREGMEEAVREHLLTVQKRTATDIVFYKCDGFYWARAGVEIRKDLPNPVFRIDKYSARLTQAGETLWNVTAQPIAGAELDTPCK
jgi:hypothetical protein